MQTELSKIEDFIKAFVNAIAAILNVEVTVVDKNMKRIAATAKFNQQGEQIQHASFFEKIFQTERPSIVENAKMSDVCNQCGNRFNCAEFADIAYPIFFDNKVCGVISIAAFSEEERIILQTNNSKFEQFLKYMSMLIESKMTTVHHSQELENQLDEVINIQKKSLNETGFIGQNKLIKEMLSLVNKVSCSDSTILIMGESGTGKEVLANVIHNNSPRNNKLMISINCSAIPENLIESELFGYEEGAFTGAKSSGHIGKFELANNSTLFLDEIGEMPLVAQAKLLRVLQEQKITRVGGSHEIPINVRVICATNQDLLTLVEKNKFRLDLYYRINVIPIAIPALKNRTDDIPLLISAFVQMYNKKFKKNIKISVMAMSALLNYDWPGNVRELKNIIEYLANINETGEVQLSDLPNNVFLPNKMNMPCDGDSFQLKSLLFEYEKSIFQQLLKNSATTKEKKLVAKKLGIGLSTLYKKMELFNIS